MVKLRILGERCNSFQRICKCSSARVVSIISNNGNEITTIKDKGGRSYTVGKKVIAKNYDGDRRNIYSNGIVFFLTREEAEEWKDCYFE